MQNLQLNETGLCWYSYVMRIDFHCHTRNFKTGDGPKRNVDDELFANKVASSGVEIIAITNHNAFDDTQFHHLKDKVADSCKLWPGVELDISYDGSKRYHLIIICNPLNIDEFSSRLSNLTNGYTYENFITDIDTAVATFDDIDCIFMPHFHKTPAIPEEEFEKLGGLLTNKNRLIAEATNVRSMGIFMSHGVNCIAGSDIKDWDLYPNMELPELRLEVENFEHLCSLLDRDSGIVKSLLDKNKSSIFEVHPSQANHEIKESIKLYNEVNVIFGDKGTGKTEVIKSLATTFKARNTPFAEYISSETKDALDGMLNTDDMLRDAGSLGIQGCESEFELIKTWGDTTPTPLSEYADHFRTYKAKANQIRIGWSRMSDVSWDEGKRLDKIRDNLSDSGEIIDSLESIKTEDYIGKEKTSQLNSLIKLLDDSVAQKYKDEAISIEALGLVNFTIGRYKYYTAAKTGNAKKPSTTGFAKFALNRLKLRDSLGLIVDNLQFKEELSYEILGYTGNKGRIDIETRYRMLNDNPHTKSSHTEFDGNITRLKETKASIQKVSRLSLSTEINTELAKLKVHLKENEIDSVSDFIGFHKQTVDKDHSPYSPSNGERSIIFIQKTLNDETAKVYLLDEPELSMANSYIDEMIRPKIIELGRQKKMVVIATHNANLAVRTLPYMTMYRSYGVDGYKTYTGNPFINKLSNIEDETDTEDWKDVSMRILEGGRDAFYDRGGIYENGRNK